MLFSCAKASNLLQTDPDIKRHWTHAVRWLRDQLEVRENVKRKFFQYEFS